MRPGRTPGEPFDLEQVPDAGRLRRRPQLRVLRERQLVVLERAVDHRRGAQHHAAHPGRGGGRQHGLRAPHVVGRPGGGVTPQVEVEREVDDDVHTAQLVGDRRVTDVEDVPLRRVAVAPPLVDGDDLLDLLRRGEPLGEQRADPGRGAGHGDDGPARTGRGRAVSRCANLRIWGTHQVSPAVVLAYGRE